MDVLRYKSVIQNMMARLKVPPHQREDTMQECYVALLEQMKEGDTEGFAAAVCKGTIVKLWREENQTRTEKPALKIDSLSDPRTAHKAAKIGLPFKAEVTDEKLNEAICSLPFAEYQVIYNLFIEGRTQEQTAGDLKMTRNQVRNRLEHGIAELKKYFEVEE